MKYAVAIVSPNTDGEHCTADERSDLHKGFHEARQRVRCTINEPARPDVLARLLKLNHDRYAEEVNQGLHEKRGSKGGQKRKAAADTSPSLFDEE